MKQNIQFISVLLFTFFLSSLSTLGQSIPVGLNTLEDVYRRGQLLGNVDINASFSSRPFNPYYSNTSGYGLNNSDIQNELHSNFKFSSTKNENEKVVFKILPLTWKQQYNSDHPTELNNGAMIPAKGYQTLLSGGVYAKYGIFSIQLQPEFVFAENKKYQGFFDENSDSLWSIYYQFSRSIDLPERFGDKPYSKLSLGQSSIRLTYKSISLGLSNENLWWGPGMKNSLLMTNNAPGFLHLTMNTVKPVKTPIGSFEGQLVGGRLDPSGYPNLDTTLLSKHNIKNVTKSEDWRYFNGIVLSYQPRWLPGLFLGATRSFVRCHNNLTKDLNSYLPVIIPLFKKTLGNYDEDSIKRDQLASVFVRWVMPESHSEIYFEYGHEDHNYDLIDLIQEPEHTAAYIIGLRKLVVIKEQTNEYVDIQFELTNFTKSLSDTYRLKQVWGWYGHYQISDGYTHNGQYLGAGIGRSSNMQSLNISWVKNLKRIGIEFKRLAHGENFWHTAIKDYRNHWVDVGGSLIGEWNFKNILLNAKIETIGSINYQWLYEPISSDPPQWWDHGKMRYNVHAEIGVTYCF